MFSLGSLTFLAPWMLASLAAVPLLWWLLRILPPRPRIVQLPTFFLLRDLQANVRTPAHTPWWLLLLRALILCLFIFAFADPVLRRADDIPGSGDVLLVIDNGWAAAANWDKRSEKIAEYLSRLGRAGRNAAMLPTAAPEDGGGVKMSNVMTPEEAKGQLTRMKPQPWPVDHDAARKEAVAFLEKNTDTHVLFFSDGLSSAETPVFLKALTEKNRGLTMLRDGAVNRPYVLREEERSPGGLRLSLERLDAAGSAVVKLVAYAGEGNVIDEKTISFSAGDKTIEFEWSFADELRNRVTRIDVLQPRMASGVFLTDSRWQQRPVGILSGIAQKETAGFLNEVYYLRRALEGGGDVTVDGQAELEKKELSAIIWPDSAGLTAVERVNLLNWVEKGGFLIRFAGPNLAAAADDPLLPVPLRHGQRAMQGALTWEKPVHMGSIVAESPLDGLAVPKDVTVLRQVLADPTPEVLEKTWIQLEDGTPFVTGGKVGKGTIVLVHATAGPDWSNFCYSGLYVEMLQRMISLSAGIAEYKAEKLLPPAMLMDGFGSLRQSAGGIVGPVNPAQQFTPSPVTPPGIYGQRDQFKAYNLGPALSPLRMLEEIPSGSLEETYALSGEESLKGSLATLAVLLLLLDTIVTLFLRGFISLPLRPFSAVLCICVILFATPAAAQEIEEAELVSSIYLGYIETGDQFTDQVSYNGLMGLKDIVNARTNIQIEGVRSVDPSRDILIYYPILYWPMTESQTALSISAARNIQDYMARGGMVVVDTRDQQFAGPEGLSGSSPGTARLRKLTENLQIAELAPVGEGHILTKSFYLLDDFPGVYQGGQLWVEKEPSPDYDSVTSILIGGNDWAAAWSAEESDRSRFIVTPGGEQQREMSYRFGVNLLMAALAGNYKADQVHVPYILERMKK